jgi:hypothetical protein
MKPMRFPGAGLWLGGLLMLSGAAAWSQPAPRVPQGRNPEAGARLPEDAPRSLAALEREQDGGRVFAWLGPFEPLLTQAQLANFRLAIRERLNEMRLLENRRRTLALELLQTAVAPEAKADQVRAKATALGQAVTELGLHQAGLLGEIQPPLTPQQRAEMRVALARMFEEGLEPLSFAPEPVGTRQQEPEPPGLWLPVPEPYIPSGRVLPQPRMAPSAPESRPRQR